jgi:hypothetical protein
MLKAYLNQVQSGPALTIVSEPGSMLKQKQQNHAPPLIVNSDRPTLLDAATAVRRETPVTVPSD